MRLKSVLEDYIGAAAEKLPWPLYEDLEQKLDALKVPYRAFGAFLSEKYEPARCQWKNVVGGEKTWEYFLKHRIERESNVNVRAGLELDTFYAYLDYEKDPVRVLEHDAVHNFGPLFKYIILKYLELDVEAAKYLDMARMQLRESPEYFKVFDKLRQFYPLTEEAVLSNDES